MLRTKFDPSGVVTNRCANPGFHPGLLTFIAFGDVGAVRRGAWRASLRSGDLRRTHSCLFVFIRGEKSVSAFEQTLRFAGDDEFLVSRDDQNFHA